LYRWETVLDIPMLKDAGGHIDLNVQFLVFHSHPIFLFFFLTISLLLFNYRMWDCNYILVVKII